MQDLLRSMVEFVDAGIIWYFFALNTFYAVLIFLSMPEIWKNWHVAVGEDIGRYLNSEALPPISVVIPAYNMEASIVDSVYAQLALHYPHHEVVCVNDGSTDATMARLEEEFDLYEVPPAIPTRIPTERVYAYYRSRTAAGLLVVDKANGGKADALNAGLCVARYPLIVAADADTIIEPDALVRLVRPFLFGDPVVAAGGTIRVVNGCDMDGAIIKEARVPRKFLAGVQMPEYLRAFLFGRLGWNRLGGNMIVSGAFGLFRRDLLLKIGGYTTGNVVEDLDLVVRLHRHLHELGEPYMVPFIPDPVAWTEVPTDLRTLGRQRDRWHRGLVHTMHAHRDMLFNRRYGRVGWLMFPFFVFGEMLAPVVELYGYMILGLGLWLGAINWHFALLFLGVAIGYQMMLSFWSVILEESTFRTYPRRRDFLRLLFFAFAEPFGYRQLTVYWRLRGIVNHVRGRSHWGVMNRKGFRDQPKAATS